jgi:hypothetical protein
LRIDLDGDKGANLDYGSAVSIGALCATVEAACDVPMIIATVAVKLEELSSASLGDTIGLVPACQGAPRAMMPVTLGRCSGFALIPQDISSAARLMLAFRVAG